MSECCLNFMDVETGKAARRIAVRTRDGAPPGLFWLAGLILLAMVSRMAVAAEDAIAPTVPVT